MPKPGTSCKLLKATDSFIVDQLSQRDSNLSVTVIFTFTSAVTHLTSLIFLNVLKFQKEGRNVVHWSHDIFTTNEETKKSITIYNSKSKAPLCPIMLQSATRSWHLAKTISIAGSINIIEWHFHPALCGNVLVRRTFWGMWKWNCWWVHKGGNYSPICWTGIGLGCL